MKVRLHTLVALALIVACQDTRQPTGPDAPSDPSKIISDGAHCSVVGIVCNPNFFFMPPMVPLPLNNPNFELGKFDNTLRTGLRVEICELAQTTGLPASDTPCNGAAIKTFAQGSVQVVNLPLRQAGWWTAFGLPADGFYYVLWDTRQSNLSVTKYYRIFVLADGMTTPLGIADVDPMASLREWKYTLTGQVIQLVDDVLLPITFRVEKGALCTGGSACTSTVVTNGNVGDPPQIVRVPGEFGAIAGASFPQGWLPAGGPQSVVVTIKRINTGINDVAAGTQSLPCHATLALQQFDGCFEFTTTPKLVANANGDQFAKPVTVAVCYVLQDSYPPDPREKFAELYASGVGEPPHPLTDVSDAAILTSPRARNCTQTPEVITQGNQSGLTRFASATLKSIKTGLNRAFGVKTAYAVDLGLGGISTAFSRIGPALSRHFQAASPQALGPFPPGVTTNATIRIVGQDHHNSDALPVGLSGLPVVFTITEGVGSVRPIDGESPAGTSITLTTNTHVIDGSATSGGGFAQVIWTMPSNPGTYHLVVTGAALDGPLTFTATVVAPVVSIDGIIGAAEWADATVYGPYTVNLPDGAQTTATVYLKNNAQQLFGAVKFGEDLSNRDDVILALMMDLNANALWDNNEDGFTLHQRIGGASRNTFFDEYALCTPANGCNEAIDTQNGGTNDGSTASTDGGPVTSVEFVKLLNSPDALDAHLVAGQTLRFFFFTNIGTGPDARAETWYPSHFTTASYTVR
jgi:hypothetical protein